MQYGKPPRSWDIFRGDSFQVEIKKPQDALLAAIKIKACIKGIEVPDVRMAIGIGEKKFNAARITESNGSAFVHSGEKFESLKKAGVSLAVQTPWPDFDEEMNLMLSLALIAMDKWTVLSAQFVFVSIANKELSQKALGKKMGIAQSSVSERQSRAYLGEIMNMEAFYRNSIIHKLK